MHITFLTIKTQDTEAENKQNAKVTPIGHRYDESAYSRWVWRDVGGVGSNLN
jgi:hypothetical protein